MSHYLPFIFHLMKGKKITRKQDMVFLSIIWPNYSRLLSKLNKSDQNSCVSMCACAHEHMQDFVCVVHGRKELNSLCWSVLQEQHLCPMLRGIPKLGGLLPQLKLDSKMKNSNKKEVYLSPCWQSRALSSPTREAVPIWKLYGHVNMASLHGSY